MKKLEKKPILLSIGTVIFDSLLYFLSKILQGPAHIMNGTIDNFIPFCVYFIIPYCFWYLLIFYIPYYYYKKDKELFNKFCVSYIIIIILANIVFCVYPSTVVRPEITNNGLLYFVTKIIFMIDTPAINCFPSLHCGVITLMLLSSLESNKLSNSHKLFMSACMILICASTLFIKQHAFIDAIGGITLTTIVYLVISRCKKLLNYTKKILKLN